MTIDSELEDSVSIVARGFTVRMRRRGGPSLIAALLTVLLSGILTVAGTCASNTIGSSSRVTVLTNFTVKVGVTGEIDAVDSNEIGEIRSVDNGDGAITGLPGYESSREGGHVIAKVS